MSLRIGVGILLVALAGMSFGARHQPRPVEVAPPPRPDPLDERFATQVRPFVERYCVGCHGPKKQAGSLDLSRDASAAAVAKNWRHWEHVGERLHAQEMPPEDAPRQPK